jgi:DNA polymerase-3 subunit gamma/tau
MSYIVLARKYRPQNFEQLKGQEVLVQTITNGFLHNKLHHAYLLTGIRGIGKTTTARIVAKTLNCSNLKTENSTITPCEECSNCKSANNGSHPDILEFDAASNTGIDDIKTMLEGINYNPAMGKYRIFIVDEVHMLSTKAFNSLLKTLEEPPSGVIFIFATTELQKVPVTILSRCQKFVLVPLSISAMVEHLFSIAQMEDIQVSTKALELIASKSSGSVRDALSMLDQASMRSPNSEITETLVESMLSLVSKSDVLNLFNSVLEGNSDEILQNLRKIKIQGVTENSILEEFLTCIYEEIQVRINKKVPYSNLLRIWNIMLPATQELSYAFNKYAILEIIFLKAVHVIASPSLENLVSGISENKILDILKIFPNSDVLRA